MNWHVSIASAAEKRLKKIHWQDAVKIASVIDSMANDPFAGDVQKMVGKENFWRRRVGSYRIFYLIYQSQKLIIISDVQRRTSKTY